MDKSIADARSADVAVEMATMPSSRSDSHAHGSSRKTGTAFLRANEGSHQFHVSLTGYDNVTQDNSATESGGGEQEGRSSTSTNEVRTFKTVSLNDATGELVSYTA
jgi:hypothetical protein